MLLHKLTAFQSKDTTVAALFNSNLCYICVNHCLKQQWGVCSNLSEQNLV